jgi:hypothetical protein
VKIKGTCRNCGRELFPRQMADAGGHCPWCGQAFNRDYTSLLVRSLENAQEHGNRLQDALENVADMEDPGLDLDEESVLQPLRDALRRIRRRGARV